MLQDILCNDEIKMSVRKSLALQVFVSPTIGRMTGTKGQVGSKVTGGVRRSLGCELDAHPPASGRRFMDFQRLPFRVEHLNDVHERAFTRNRPAAITEKMVS